MSISERVLAAAKTSYAKYGFKREELTKISNLIAANLKDESTDEEISTALKNNEGYAEMMQSVYNRGVSETNKKFEGYIKPEPPASSTTTPTDLYTWYRRRLRQVRNAASTKPSKTTSAESTP